MRRLDQLKPAVLLIPGEGLAAPFWSPRSTDLAWFDADNLKRAPVEGGRTITICRCPMEPVAARSARAASHSMAMKFLSPSGISGSLASRLTAVAHLKSCPPLPRKWPSIS